MNTFEAFCPKCRKKVHSEDRKAQTLTVKGVIRYQLVGKCPFCGGKVFRFVKKEELTSEEKQRLGVE